MWTYHWAPGVARPVTLVELWSLGQVNYKIGFQRRREAIH
jgi:hypothetical protein